MLPRILHLIPADGIGGVEVAAKSMTARYDMPFDFCLHFIESVAPQGRGIANIVSVALANWHAFRNSRQFDPDIIICSLWRSVPLAVALRASCRKAKLVYFLHFGSTVHRLDTILSAVAMKAADEIWADSAATLHARRVEPSRGRVISFVTEQTAVLDKAFVGPSFVSWGRLHRQKGFDRAIRLIALMVECGIDVSYDIYGPDGGEREALTMLIRDLKLDQRVRLRDSIAREMLPAVAAKHSFFLQLSRSEGMCMAAVEAMQFGLVPVATAVGEMARYVEPGETGIIVDPARLDVAAASVAALIDDPAEWRRQSAAAMRYWHDMPLYADDICRAAADLVGLRG